MIKCMAFIALGYNLPQVDRTWNSPDSESCPHRPCIHLLEADFFFHFAQLKREECWSLLKLLQQTSASGPVGCLKDPVEVLSLPETG